MPALHLTASSISGVWKTPENRRHLYSKSNKSESEDTLFGDLLKLVTLESRVQNLSCAVDSAAAIVLILRESYKNIQVLFITLDR